MFITEKLIDHLTNTGGFYSILKFLMNQKLAMLTGMTFTLCAHDRRRNRGFKRQHLFLPKNKSVQITLEIMSLQMRHQLTPEKCRLLL